VRSKTGTYICTRFFLFIYTSLPLIPKDKLTLPILLYTTFQPPIHPNYTPFLQLNLDLKPRLPRRLRILGIIRLQLRQNTLHIILSLPQRLRSRRILRVVRLERR
jgi:hypothetical protein